MAQNIALLSIHAAHNFGSMLQAYALKRTIEKLGYRCGIINYKSVLQEQVYSLSGKKIVNARTLVRNAYRRLNKGKFNRKAALFDEFLRDYLTGDQDTIHTKEEIIAELRDGQYDKIVVGSDQIWNTTLEDIDDTYFLSGVTEWPKIAYAASFGSGLGSVEAQPEMLDAIRRFQSVSVREKKAAEMLARNRIDFETVLDPVYLLEKAEWETVERGKAASEPYLFMYGFGFHPAVAEAARKLSRRLGLPVVNPIIHPRAAVSGFRNRYDTGPREFLSLIRNASCICTNSFHGTSFSILYGKPFFAIDTDVRKENRWDDRIPSLLGALGLSDRFVPPSFAFGADLPPEIDYAAVHSLLEQAKRRSLSFLERSLQA